MSKFPLTFLPFLLLAVPAVAQDTAERKIPWANKFFTGTAEMPPPVILHDFGTLPKGTIKTYRFKMTNIYAFPVEVKLPKVPSCICVSILEYTGKMEPRDTGHIDIKIDTSRVEGPKTVDLPIRFECRDPKTRELLWSEAKLEIRAVSRSDITITPGAVVFGTVPAGQTAAQSVSVVYTGRQRDWAITAVEYRKELMDVKVVGPARGSIVYEVTATLNANAKAGRFDDQIILKTNDPVAPALTLTVTGEIQPPLSIAVSDQLNFRGVEVGKKVELRITVVSSARKFKVKKVEGAGDGFAAVILPQDANKVQPLTITFEPSKVGPVKKVLTIETDSGESVKLTVEGVGKEPAQ